MKLLHALMVFCTLFLFAKLSNARSEPGDYWKSIMKDEPMPEAIKELLHDHDQTSDKSKTYPFIKDFDVKPNVIIYHSHGTHKEEKPSLKDHSEPKHEDEQKKDESLIERIKRALKVPTEMKKQKI